MHSKTKSSRRIEFDITFNTNKEQKSSMLWGLMFNNDVKSVIYKSKSDTFHCLIIMIINDDECKGYLAHMNSYEI